MSSNTKRIRIDYAPLNVAVSVECLTPDRPALQVFDSTKASGNEYEPDREVTPSQFWPQAIVNANDGSWTNQYGNVLLVEMHWFVDDVDIAEHPDWQGTNSVGDAYYEIDETGTNYRGTLTVRKNIDPSKQYSMRFEAVIADSRLGTRLPVKTDAFILSTEDVSEDRFSISIGDDQIIRYNPFKDKLHLYDYKVANGKIAASSAAELAATDANAYKREIQVTVYKGGEVITEGFTLKLFRVNGNDSYTEMAVGTDRELLALSNSGVTLDLRIISKADYMLRAVLSDSTVPNPQIQFSVNRYYQSFVPSPTNGTAILPSDEQRFDEVMVNSEGCIVEEPASILKVEWYSTSATKTNLFLNEGHKTLFTIAKTGIGKTYTDNWLDISVECEIKPTYDVAVDENGDTLTDENGNILIFN